MTTNEIIHEIMEINVFGDSDGNIARDWELMWFLTVHYAD